MANKSKILHIEVGWGDMIHDNLKYKKGIIGKVLLLCGQLGLILNPTRNANELSNRKY